MKYIKQLAIIVLSAAILLFYITTMDFSGMWTALGRVNLLWFPPIIFMAVFSLYTRALRWRIFLWKVKPLPRNTLFVTQTIGFFAILTVPARMGELVKGFLVHKKDGVPFGAAMATLVLERVFDLVMVLSMLVWALIYVNFPETSVTVFETTLQINTFVVGTGKGFAVMCALMIAFLAGLSIFPALVHRITEVCCSILPGFLKEKILSLLKSFEEGLAVLKEPSQLFWSCIWTVATWTVICSTEYMLFKAFNFGVGVPETITLCTILALAVVIPGPPLFLGLFQGACLIVVQYMLGQSRGTADAYGNLLWALQIFPILILGYIFLVKYGISFSSLRHVKEEIAEEERSPSL
jgi:glycosyltransferase 2 family protein